MTASMRRGSRPWPLAVLLTLPLLAGCAAASPGAAPTSPAPTPGTVSPAPTAEPIAVACGDLSDQLTAAGLRLAETFGSSSALAAAAVGGFSCFAEPAAPAEGEGAVQGAAIVALPASLVDPPELTGPTCGDLWDGRTGCRARALVGSFVAEAIIIGDHTAESTAETLTVVASLLEAALGDAPPSTTPTVRTSLDCLQLDLQAQELPTAVGPFVRDFGGTDSAGSTLSALDGIALSAVAGQRVCATTTGGGFDVRLESLGAGSDLLDHPGFVGSSMPIQLDGGREARMLVLELPAGPEGALRDWARIVLDLEGTVLIVSVTDQGDDPAGAPIEESAGPIVDAIVRAVEASR